MMASYATMHNPAASLPDRRLNETVRSGVGTVGGWGTALLAACLFLLPTVPLHAQQISLERVDSLVQQGSYAEARSVLQQWWEYAEAARQTDRPRLARALFLRARLATDLRAAEDDYLALALGHPAAPETPAALLYLGQGLAAAGEHQRAATYLERLTRDHPNSTHRPTALLWLSRIQLAAEQPDAACASARQGGTATRDPDLRGLLRTAEEMACAAAARSTGDKPFMAAAEPVRRSGTSTGSAAAAPPTTPGADRDRATVPTAARGFALQVGAFREARGAAGLAARLRRAGFEPRIVLVPGSALHRVRVGTFGSAAEAGARARELRTAGFEAVVASDVASERIIP